MVLALREQVGVVGVALHVGEEAKVALHASEEGVEEGLRIWKEKGRQTSMGVVVEEVEHQTLVGVVLRSGQKVEVALHAMGEGVEEVQVELPVKKVVVVEEEEKLRHEAMVVVEAGKLHTEKVEVEVGVGVLKLHV